MIIDSDILIWLLRDQPLAVRFVAQIPPNERNISVISELELLRGCRTPGELKTFQDLLADQFSEILPLNGAACDTARRLMNQFAMRRRPGINDLLIAAIALLRGEAVATGNVKHFDYIPGLKIKPFRQ